MWTFNLGIHDATTNTGFMYVWNESIASRGAQEVGSCLKKHIQNCIPPEVNHLILYSDSCGGQNRNIKMSLLLMHVLQTSQTLDIIDQKFFIPGHSFNECDQDFGVIEKAKKYNPEIYIPNHWVNVIKTAKKRSPKFQVTEMTRDDFVSTIQLEKDIVNRKVFVNGGKVQWLKTSWIRIEKGQPRILTMKQSYDDDVPFSTLDLQRRVKGRRSSFENIPIPLLYPAGRALTQEKLKDLMDLCHYIPPVHHDFYRQLRSDNTIDIPI